MTVFRLPHCLGAQNVYWEAKGAFTGESSCDMLKSAGCTYCIIGHPSVATTSTRPTRTRTRRPSSRCRRSCSRLLLRRVPRGPRGWHLCRACREPGQGWPCWS
ncbi:MAG: triose-phosphate isomerase [Collinsella aerofaciens]